MAEQWYRGRVESYTAGEGFGYIEFVVARNSYVNSEGRIVPAEFRRDLCFVHSASLSGRFHTQSLNVDMPVFFQLMSPGRGSTYQAMRIQECNPLPELWNDRPTESYDPKFDWMKGQPVQQFVADEDRDYSIGMCKDGSRPPS